MNTKELRLLLINHGVNLSLWGRGKAKTLTHLVKEIQKQECVLREENSILLREIRPLVIRVLYRHQKQNLFIHEDRQVFSNGRIRRRNYDSIQEKLTKDEQPGEKAVRRALSEELGINEISSIRPISTTYRLAQSQSYPTLWSRKEIRFYEVEIPTSEFRPEGYREIQEDKTTFFVWKKQL